MDTNELIEKLRIRVADFNEVIESILALSRHGKSVVVFDRDDLEAMRQHLILNKAALADARFMVQVGEDDQEIKAAEDEAHFARYGW